MLFTLGVVTSCLRGGGFSFSGGLEPGSPDPELGVPGMLGKVPEKLFFWFVGSARRRRRSLEAAQGMAKAAAWIRRGRGYEY